ncbi:MAG: MotA/TolQ/ExbB proton channel family protein [Candidatus Omnitrophica bacterium]|nr:MotA/TolQ/ExbB proton channel family protein [Candidatus Omnitrophota bacterium]
MFGFFDIMQKGGPLMWCIFICSVITLAVFIERIWHLYRARIDTQRFVDGILTILKRNKIMEAVEICEHTPGPIAHILKAGIMKHDRPRTEIREVIEDAASHEIPRLEKNLAVLATIAHVSPLIGLLGTVTGMIKAFQTIQQESAAARPVMAGQLAGGIWEALITTAAGLGLAILAYIAYNYFVNWVNGFIVDMEKSATHLVDVLSERGEPK